MIVSYAKKHQALIRGQTDQQFWFPVNYELDIFGMTIDNIINFNSHISAVCNKVNNQFNVMLRFRNIFSKNTIFEVSQDIHPATLFYYCAVWHSVVSGVVAHATVKNWKHFDKRILRFILNDYTFHYTTSLNKVEITSLYI